MKASATQWSALIVATLSSFLTPFMISATHIALPAIDREFDADAIALSWVATAYLLAAAVSLVPVGKLADIHGRKKMFLLGIIIFTAGSLLAALATSVQMLILFRILQGSGSAMIFTTGIAIITSVFPAGERGRALGITVAAVYIGLSCGPFFGGILTQHFGWRSIFVTILPLGLLIVYLTAAWLKGEWAEARGESFDWIGALIYGLSVVALMVGISLLPAGRSYWLITGGIAGLVGFVRWEMQMTHPVFEVSLFSANRVFGYSCLAALIHYSATFGVTFLLSLYLQYIKGLTPRQAGLLLVAQPLMMALFSPLAGKISDRIEPRRIASAGMALTATGLMLLTMLQGETPIAFIVGSLMLLGFGFAFFSSPNMNAIMSSVEKRFYGIASGSVGTMRLLGQMLSMGIATMTFALLIGRVPLTATSDADFLKAITIAFVIFTLLCTVGIYFSAARGRLHTHGGRQKA